MAKTPSDSLKLGVLIPHPLGALMDKKLPLSQVALVTHTFLS